MAKRKPKAPWVQAGADIKGEFLPPDDQESHTKQRSQFDISSSKVVVLGKQGGAEAFV